MLSPNSKFAKIKDIYRARQKDGDSVDRLSEFSGSEIGGETEDCIIVAPIGGKKRK